MSKADQNTQVIQSNKNLLSSKEFEKNLWGLLNEDSSIHSSFYEDGGEFIVDDVKIDDEVKKTLAVNEGKVNRLDTRVQEMELKQQSNES